jgi:hypothetical protein
VTAATVITGRVSRPPKDWDALSCAVNGLLAALPHSDGRLPVLTALRSALDDCERARRAGLPTAAAALWERCGVLACRMAGRWCA